MLYELHIVAQFTAKVIPIIFGEFDMGLGRLAPTLKEMFVLDEIELVVDDGK
jgi:hypothetical protein